MRGCAAFLSALATAVLRLHYEFPDKDLRTRFEILLGEEALRFATNPDALPEHGAQDHTTARSLHVILRGILDDRFLHQFAQVLARKPT